MSGLATALRLRRRQLDGLAMKIAAGWSAVDELRAGCATLDQKRETERARAPLVPVPSDPWFARSALSLASLRTDLADSEKALARLRTEALTARALLHLLEEALDERRRSERRQRERRAQAILDDRTAALWRPS